MEKKQNRSYFIGETGACNVNGHIPKLCETLKKYGYEQCSQKEWQAKRVWQGRDENREIFFKKKKE